MLYTLRILGACAVLVIGGCGPSAHERTLSVLNIEADQWQGGKDFGTKAADAYGNALSSRVEKGPLHYTLEVRSNGRDGLPKNSDDIVVTRHQRHGETDLVEEARKSVEAVSSGATSGAIKGIKEGLGLGGEK
jgi:hypothetical protein